MALLFGLLLLLTPLSSLVTLVVPNYVNQKLNLKLNRKQYTYAFLVSFLFSVVGFSITIPDIDEIDSNTEMNASSEESQKDDESTEVLGLEENIEDEQSEQTSEIILNESSDFYFDMQDFNDKKVFTVTEVVDGDTVRVTENSVENTVRLIGIDTPETRHPNKGVECFGKEATDYAKEQLLNQNVLLIVDDTQDNEDRYGRILRYIVRADGYFYNLNAVKNGFAQEYTYQVPYEYQTSFKEAEQLAMDNSLGLFGSTCDCASEAGEVSRTCVACNQAEVTEKTWSCNTITSTATDSSCSSLCEPAPQTQNSSAPSSQTPPQQSVPIQQQPSAPAPTYTCNCSKTCGAMSSCEEAYFQLNQCGCSQRDGDSDGVPCESICL